MSMMLLKQKNKKIKPRDVQGNVLAYEAKKSVNKQIPTSSTTTWYDQSKIKNNIAYSNLVINNNYVDSTTGITISAGSCTLSASNNIITTTGTGTDKWPRFVQNTNIPYVNGHKIYNRVRFKLTSIPNAVCGFIFYIRASGMSNVFTTLVNNGNTVLNKQYELSCILTLTASGSGDLTVSNEPTFVQNSDALGATIEQSQIISIDLTALGLDTLSASQCDALFGFTSSSNIASIPNDMTLNNLLGTSASGFNKVCVQNSKGENVQYTTLAPNADFSSVTSSVATGWQMSLVPSKSCSGGIQYFTVDTQYRRFSMTNKIAVNTGDRVYGRAMVNNSTNGVIMALFVLNETINRASKAHSTTAGFENLSAIATCLTGDTNIGIRIEDDRASAWTEIQVKQPFMINLTTNIYVQALEAQLGRNLTVDECDRLFAFTTTSSNVIVDVQYALSLDGSTNYGAMPNFPSIDITTGEFALACTFRAAVGASYGHLIYKGFDGATNLQYDMYYDPSNKYVYFGFNNNVINCDTGAGSVVENTWYNVIVYRNSLGVYTPYLNKVAKNITTNSTPLISTTNTNVRLGGRSNNATGTQQGSLLKGDISTASIYQDTLLNINKILMAEYNVSRDYTG